MTPPGSWWLAFVEASSNIEDEPVEVVGLDRVEYVSGLTKWSGTQGSGTTLASFGVSHTTTNNVEIDMGVATAPSEAVGVALFDAESGGNCWMVYMLPLTLIIDTDDNPKLIPGNIGFSLGLSGGMSDYLANKLIDKLFRLQAYDWPASLWSMGFTSPPSNSGGGTEIGGGVGYARAEIVSDTGSWDNPTTGLMTNAVVVAHPTPTGIQGVWTHAGLSDANAAGNLMFWHALDTPRTVALGSPAPNYSIGAMSITWD